ncbi:MAG: methyltransferase domain-containing protein [Thermoproteus sp.]
MFYEIALIVALAISIHLLWPHITGRGAGYGTSDIKAAEKAIRAVGVKGKVFYELGCGYGAVLRLAYREGAVVVGVEIDPIRALICKLRCWRCRIILGDMFKVPLRDADIVYIFQWPSVNEKLSKKFNEELKRDAIVISYYWEVPNMELIYLDEKAKIYVYRPKT